MFGTTLIKMQSNRGTLLLVVLASAFALGQTSPAPSGAAGTLEFPVTLRQKVIAGTTPVGTEIQAKLTVATLVNGTVIPEGAILSGEVTESSAKSGDDPSRLAIRMGSVQWKSGSAPTVIELPKKVYLTAWYYPFVLPSPSDDPNSAANTSGRWGSAGPYPDPNLRPTAPLPGHGTDNDSAGGTSVPKSGVSQHRVAMKAVDSNPNSDGSITLTSKHSNIKLDKQNTYVLATSDLLPPK
jgi:hypothetical protein